MSDRHWQFTKIPPLTPAEIMSIAFQQIADLHLQLGDSLITYDQYIARTTLIIRSTEAAVQEAKK